MSTTTAPAAARQRKPVNPVSGSCRWVRRIAWPFPGVVRINGVDYAALPLSYKPGGPAVGYRLTNQANGKVYDLTADFTSCDCSDFTFRREHLDPKGCKHCAALRKLMA